MFENYEIRIDNVNRLLNKYGISSIEDAQNICKSYDLDVYKIPVEIEKEVNLHFSIDGEDYSIKLTRHRKKK